MISLTGSSTREKQIDEINTLLLFSVRRQTQTRVILLLKFRGKVSDIKELATGIKHFDFKGGKRVGDDVFVYTKGSYHVLFEPGTFCYITRSQAKNQTFQPIYLQRTTT